jgi:hypothetical protein
VARLFRRPSAGPPLVDQLLLSGARAASGPQAHAAELERHVLALTVSDPEVDSQRLLTARLLAAVARLHEHGWQPADLLHVVGRAWTQRVQRLAAAVLAQEAATTHAAVRAPEAWAAQLADHGPDHGPDVVAAWHRREGLDPADAWRDGLRLLGQLTQLPRVDPLLPPPSEWGRSARPTVARTTALEPKVLARVRALLAKAESTDFPEEADALTAKAQDLMTRHAIDEAVLHAGEPAAGAVLARRVHVSNPYASAKVQLLDAVGRVNEVRVVWTDAFGTATVVGHPADLDTVELVFTSLLVQATRALAEAARTQSAKSFRRAFLLAYALRIGERLEQARAHARGDAERTYGAALVPVLAERSEAVDAAFTTMFPALRAPRRTRVDARGWDAGRAAADRADLGR